ncbi:MAG TPA: hypothetical protein VLH36_10170 [Steroidobacteraceae bacterium]|nr:hypothetical protein [Steroidobacteraceae bacterium]
MPAAKRQPLQQRTETGSVSRHVPSEDGRHGATTMPFIPLPCARGDVFDIADSVLRPAEKLLIQAFRLLRHPSCSLALFVPDSSNRIVRRAPHLNAFHVQHS